MSGPASYQHDSTANDYENTGFDWNWEHSQGAFIPVEIGYQTSFQNAQYPAKYNAGFYEDTASYTEANGQLGARDAFWGQFQQVVWRPDRGTNQSLSVFGGAIVYSGNSPNWGQDYSGFTIALPSRRGRATPSASSAPCTPTIQAIARQTDRGRF